MFNVIIYFNILIQIEKGSKLWVNFALQIAIWGENGDQFTEQMWHGITVYFLSLLYELRDY